MAFPEFFARVPAITLRDPLAELLGAAEGGLIEYRFADVVKLTGHSCPTVAGAWLMTVRALRALYGDEIPERGNIAVALRESLDGGVAGVIGSVAGLLTGAAGAGGFKGLGGRHSRRNLLLFGVAGIGSVTFMRLDTDAAVDCTLRLEMVPADPRLGKLLGAVLNGTANPDDTRQFGSLWQERVARILIDHGEDHEIVALRPCANSL
jgi:formylmethanofuran dehydrogenase subunit E